MLQACVAIVTALHYRTDSPQTHALVILDKTNKQQQKQQQQQQPFLCFNLLTTYTHITGVLPFSQSTSM
jgi:hypothetical protein